MAQNNLLQLLLNGTATKKVRMLVASGSTPIPINQTIEILVLLLSDSDPEVSSRAEQTLRSLGKEEIIVCLQAPECSQSVLEYFARSDTDDRILQTIISNPSASGKIVEKLALSVQEHLLERILDNRVRILQFPAILKNIQKNPRATPETRRVVAEIDLEFFGDKKKEYVIEAPVETAGSNDQDSILPLESAIPLDDLSLEGLPVDSEARQAELIKKISSLSVREKIRYALFGTREIRTIMVRDTNKEVARSVLRSPKLTENEVEGISAMRGVAEEILTEIGNSKEWIRSYVVVHNLVRNPKTPPAISQRLLFRIRTKDLTLLARDRNIPEAVRHNATRALNQRTRLSP
jgi:hypothetical protein